MKSVTQHLDNDIVDEDGVVIENETGTPSEDQPQPKENIEEGCDNREEISLTQQLRNEAESYKDRAELKKWFESLPIAHKQDVATWITEVLNKLPKQKAAPAPAPKELEESDVGNPNNWDEPKPQPKTTSKKLAAVVEEDDLEPAEEGDAF